MKKILFLITAFIGIFFSYEVNSQVRISSGNQYIIVEEISNNNSVKNVNIPKVMTVYQFNGDLLTVRDRVNEKIVYIDKVHFDQFRNGDNSDALFTKETLETFMLSNTSFNTAGSSASTTANNISFTPYGSISSTDIQAALQEVVDEGNGGGINYDEFFVGRTITQDNFNSLTGTSYTTLEDIFFPEEPPTASLTLTAFGQTNGSNRTVEITTGGTTSITANWTAGRQSSTGVITSIDVEGNNQSFSQPVQGTTTNGTQALSINNNINTTVNLTVSTAGDQATDAISITWRYRRYWGLDANGTLTDPEILALGGSELSNSRAKTFIVSSSNQRVVFCYETSLGDLTSIRVNDFESIAAFTKTTQSHTNVNGASTDYNVYVSNNALSGIINVITQ